MVAGIGPGREQTIAHQPSAVAAARPTALLALLRHDLTGAKPVAGCPATESIVAPSRCEALHDSAENRGSRPLLLAPGA